MIFVIFTIDSKHYLDLHVWIRFCETVHTPEREVYLKFLLITKEDFHSPEFIIGRCLLHYSPLTTPCMTFPSAPYLLSHRMQWEVGRKPNTSEGNRSKFCTSNIMLNWRQITLTKDTRWEEKHIYPFYIPNLLTLYWWWPQREMKYCQVLLVCQSLILSVTYSLVHPKENKSRRKLFRCSSFR